mgnify:FL=1
MKILKAKYYKTVTSGEISCIKVTYEGQDANSNVSVPLDVNNEDYQLIMKQVKDGTLTIEEAD